MTDLKQQVEAKLSQDMKNGSQDANTVAEDALVELMEAELDKVVGAAHASSHKSVST